MNKYIMFYETYFDLIKGIKYHLAYEDAYNYYYKTYNDKTLAFSKVEENLKYEIGDIVT